MPIDFAKLNDPDFIAKCRAEDEARSAAEAKQREAVNLCLEHNTFESLSANERSLVRSCQHKLNTFGIISEKQEDWLFSIAKRFR